MVTLMISAGHRGHTRDDDVEVVAIVDAFHFPFDERRRAHAATKEATDRPTRPMKGPAEDVETTTSTRDEPVRPLAA